MGKTDQYRLPTEAEWEYACRAGSAAAYCFGNDPRELGQYAWYAGNSDKHPHPVKKLKPNAWGLYDMHGNIWEWCADCYSRYTNEAVIDPTGPPNYDCDRMNRGGSCGCGARGCRSAIRRYSPPLISFGDLGFRLARSVTLGT